MNAVATTDACVSSSPALHPWMLVPRRSVPVFPFDQPTIRYYYLARNAIYALANAWNLAGQEVLVPAYCHGVEMQALLHAGARLRYYPVRTGMKVLVEDVVARVTPQTRAVYLIHYLGFPGPVEELSAFCRAHALYLIEDCALALFSSPGGRALGSWGDAAIFCIYKTLPLPNGGALVVRQGLEAPPDDVIAPSMVSTLSYTVSAAALRRDRIRHAAGGGDTGAGSGKRSWLTGARERAKPVMEKLGMVKVATEDFDVRYARLGMSGLCHHIIAAQNAAEIIERRRRNYLALASRLARIATLVRPELPDGVCPLFFPIRTPHKLALREALAARGLETVNFWWFHAPGVDAGGFSDADDMRRTVLELPCHQDLTPDVTDWIADEVSRLRVYL
jgi:perosamine synthetase